MMQEIIIRSTGAIGDLIIASGLQKQLDEKGYKTGHIARGFMAPLWDGLENAQIYTSDDLLPEDAREVDIGGFLGHNVHSQQLNGRHVHLLDWMAHEFELQSRVSLQPSIQDIRIHLTKTEVEESKAAIHQISSYHGNRPVVLLAPSSSVKNKNISRRKLEAVVNGIKDFSAPCIRSVDSKDERIDELYVADLDELGLNMRTGGPGLFLAADSVVSVDSAPLHMYVAAIQGTPAEYTEGLNTAANKAIAVLGSSHPAVVAYPGNRIVSATGDCPIAPCGIHGYHSIESAGDHFGTKIYGTKDPEKDKSGCKYVDYSEMETALCMEAISAEEIIENIRDSLR